MHGEISPECRARGARARPQVGILASPAGGPPSGRRAEGLDPPARSGVVAKLGDPGDEGAHPAVAAAASGGDLRDGLTWRHPPPRLVGGENCDVEGRERVDELTIRPGEVRRGGAVGMTLGGTDLVGDDTGEVLVPRGPHRPGGREGAAPEHPQVVEP